MAFDDFDEYEQSEQVRKWLRENGLSIVIGVVLALALIFGWRQWQAHRASHGAQAAERYAALQTALAAGQTAQANSAAETLEKDYADSPYAALGAAARADLAVEEGKLDEAYAALQWAVDHEKSAALHSMYQLRLARVELAQGNAKQALAHLESVPAQDYRAIAQELRGDALLKLGRAADARGAYTAALAAMSNDAAPGQRQSLQMKLDDLVLHPLAPPTLAHQPGKQGT